MRQLDFYRLTRPVQERFIGATRGAAVPSPLLGAPAGRQLPVFNLASIVVFTLALLIAMGLGFGDLRSGLALSPVWMLAVYAVCVAAVTVNALWAAAAVGARGQLPFRPALFVFPVGVIDARSSRLRVYPLVELREIHADQATGRVRLAFTKGATFEFPVAQGEQAPAVREALLGAQRRLQQAEASQNAQELAALDPLRDSGIPSPLMPVAPIQRKIPAWSRFAIPLALGIGFVVGSALWLTRNGMSERRLYAAAKQENSVAAYRRYLRAGGDRVEVSEILLPRAELLQARRAGTIAAIQQFIDEHPKTRIQPEVTAAVREALLKELEAAHRAGTLTALRQLEKRSPHTHLIQAELQLARRAVYKRAQQKFRAAAARDNPLLVPFFERLLSYAEKHGSRVEVRFWLLPSPGEEQVDNRVRTNPYYVGVKCLPSQYFKGKYVRQREEQTGKAIVERLQAAFPKDVLEFTLGSQLTGESKTLPKVKVPTLFVEHRARLSGTYFSERPKGIYVGLALAFKVTFKIPKSSKTLDFKFSAWRPPDIDAILKRQPPAEEVYEDMASGGYEQFREKLLAFFFKQP
jgi:hypothetical protein